MGLKEHIVFPEIDFDKVDEDLGNGHRDRQHGEPTLQAKALLKAIQHALHIVSAGRKFRYG